MHRLLSLSSGRNGNETGGRDSAADRATSNVALTDQGRGDVVTYTGPTSGAHYMVTRESCCGRRYTVIWSVEAQATVSWCVSDAEAQAIAGRLNARAAHASSPAARIGFLLGHNIMPLIMRAVRARGV